MERKVAFFIFLLIFSGGCRSDESDVDGLSIVVSGGISLGSYQGGMTWGLLAATRVGNQSRKSGEAFVDFSDQSVSPKHYELKTFTGASAGNINAILAAIEWCLQGDMPGEGYDALMRPEESLFWKVWTRTGIQQLFPPLAANDYSYFESDKGEMALFHRNYFDNEVVDDLQDVFNKIRFDRTHFSLVKERVEGGVGNIKCSVDIGVSATSLEPKQYEVVPGLEIPVQRYILLANIGGSGARLRVSGVLPQKADSAKLDSIQAMGVVAELPERDMLEKSLKDVFSMAAASSAFPLAFAPKSMEICERDEGGGQFFGAGKVGRCSLGYRHRVINFVDGGVFDNAPLSAAVNINRIKDKEGGALIYIDQDARRMPETQKSVGGKNNNGISGIYNLVAGSIGSARQYELFNAGRDPSLKKYDVIVTDRYPNLVGDYLFAFAAFLGTPFREVDFYSGIYDGFYTYSSRFVCNNADKDLKGQCLRNSIKSIIEKTKLEEASPLAFMVVNSLCERELDNNCAEKSGEEGYKGKSPNKDRKLIIASLFNALRFHGSKEMSGQASFGSISEGLYSVALNDGFVDFLSDVRSTLEGQDKSIRNRLLPDSYSGADGSLLYKVLPDDDDQSRSNCGLGFNDSDENVKYRIYRNSCFVDEVFSKLVFDTRSELNQLQVELVRREHRVEERAGTKTAESFNDIFGLLSASSERNHGMEWNRNSVPDDNSSKWLWSLLPAHVTANLANKGWQVAYQPSYEYWCGLGVTFPLIPYMKDGGGDSAKWAAGLGLSWNRHANFLSAVELSAQSVGDYDASIKRAFALDFGSYFLANKLRLGVRHSRNVSEESSAYEGWTVSLGLSDIAGWAYWAERIWR